MDLKLFKNEARKLELSVWGQAERMGIERTQENVDWLARITTGALYSNGSDTINELIRNQTENSRELIKKAIKEYEAATLNERGLAMISFALAMLKREDLNDPAGSCLGLLCEAYYASGILEQSINGSAITKSLDKMFSRLGTKGADTRHAPMRELRDWALSKYQAGSWPSANKAAHDLKNQVMAHGRTIGAILTEQNAQRTIAEWIRNTPSR